MGIEKKTVEESSVQKTSQSTSAPKKQQEKPAVKSASIVRKKQTMEIENIKKKSKLGKAVIAPPPGYANRLRKAASSTATSTSNVIPTTIQTELPSEKEDRRKKKDKTDRFERVDRDKGDKLRSSKKRARTKLRTPKMEIKI